VLHHGQRLVSGLRRYLVRRRARASHPGSEELAHPMDVEALGDAKLRQMLRKLGRESVRYSWQADVVCQDRLSVPRPRV
jgi:hypothetical protein